MSNLQKRNRTRTTQKILTALEDELQASGLAKTGVNRVSERAGVSKVLIYRYFGSMEGLIAHYVKMSGVFPDYKEEENQKNGKKSNLGKVWSDELVKSLRHFRQNAATREILKSSFVVGDTVADAAYEALDAKRVRVIEQLLSGSEDADVVAVAGIILGGLAHLALLSEQQKTLAGLSLNTAEGVKRTEKAIKTICQALNLKEEVALKVA